MVFPSRPQKLCSIISANKCAQNNRETCAGKVTAGVCTHDKITSFSWESLQVFRKSAPLYGFTREERQGMIPYSVKLVKRPTSPKQGPCDRTKPLRNLPPPELQKAPTPSHALEPEDSAQVIGPVSGFGQTAYQHGSSRTRWSQTTTDPQTLYCVFSFALGYWAEPRGQLMSVSQTSKGLLQPFSGWMDSCFPFSTTGFLRLVPKLRKGFLLCPAGPSPFLTQTPSFLTRTIEYSR